MQKSFTDGETEDRQKRPRFDPVPRNTWAAQKALGSFVLSTCQDGAALLSSEEANEAALRSQSSQPARSSFSGHERRGLEEQRLSPTALARQHLLSKHEPSGALLSAESGRTVGVLSSLWSETTKSTLCYKYLFDRSSQSIVRILARETISL